MIRVDEDRVVAIGRDLLTRARAARPRFPTLAWFDDAGMAWTMRDEVLKAHLFRFVDALPYLHSDRQVIEHLAEYLGPVRDRLPWPVGHLLGVQAWPIRPVVASASRVAALRLAHRFIAGDTPTTAARSLGDLRRRRLAFTVDLLGEAVLSDEEAQAYQRSYLTLLERLAQAARSWPDDDLLDRDGAGTIPRVNVSIKLSALTCRWDPLDPVGTSLRVRDRLRPVLRAAKAVGAFVNVDMEHHAYKDLTIAILCEILAEAEFRSWPHAGIAIQAYLRSALDDLTALAAWAHRRGTPVWVRLVKGAYWDTETVMAAQRGWPVPVFTDKAASDAHFEACTEFLFAHREALRPALAGHNVRSIAHALACAEAVGAHPRDYEFQMLYGMVESLKDAVASQGRRVRVYAPFGALLPGMAYLVRRLLENTSNTSFVRAGFLEDAAAEHLLMRPEPQPSAPVATPAGFINEPQLDFSRPDHRDQIDRALREVRASLPRRVVPVIAGQMQTADVIWRTVMNPSRLSEKIAEVAMASAGQADQAMAAALAAFPAWRDAGVRARAAALERLAAVLGERRDRLIALIVLEVGKDRREADAEVCEAIDFCRFYAAEAIRLQVPRCRDVAGELNEQIHEPRGVAVIIAPWNFPLAILTGMAVAALVTGNTVVIKPAEQASAVGAELMSAILAADLPSGVANLLPGIGETIGPVLVADPRVEIIAFTGSRSVGLAIARAALGGAERVGSVTRVIAEMGGKNAIIVDDDADLDEAVAGVIQSAFGFQGQKCSACSRVIVLSAVHEAFLERLAAAVRSLVLGEAEDPAPGIGPVIDGEAVDRLRAVIAGVRLPARIVAAVDDSAWRQRGHFVGPQVIAGVEPGDALAQDELFGPVLAVLRARDLEHALTIANSTPYALTGGCFSRSPARLAEVRRRFRVGNLYLNRPITGALVDRQPFGGFKLSGLGAKAGGPEYLLQFVETRAITENTLRHGFATQREE